MIYARVDGGLAQDCKQKYGYIPQSNEMCVSLRAEDLSVPFPSYKGKLRQELKGLLAVDI